MEPSCRSSPITVSLARELRRTALAERWPNPARSIRLPSSLGVRMCASRPGITLILNVASKARAVGSERIATMLPETKLEAELVIDPAFARRFGLAKLDRQFPVGLFEGAVTGNRAVFTGGKSAIDIVGVGDAGFWLFELKAGGNAPIGGLTELLFYASLIRDAAGSAARFRFSAASAKTVIGPADVVGATAINAVLLVEAGHPLLDHPELITALNAAAAKVWNVEPGAVPVTFTRRGSHERGPLSLSYGRRPDPRQGEKTGVSPPRSMSQRPKQFRRPG